MENNTNKVKQKICFVIGPIGNVDSDTRKRSDQILNHIIKPVVSKFEYKVTRSDIITEPGSINHKIIENILNCELVIADLSDHNANVFYELALRHISKKPFIQIIINGQNNPFDVFDIRTIEIDLHDLDKVEKAKVDIENQIKTIEEKGMLEVKTPISLTLDFTSLVQSGDIVQKTLADLIQQMSTLQNKLNIIEQKVDKKRKIFLEEQRTGFNQDLFSPNKKFNGFIEGESEDNDFTVPEKINIDQLFEILKKKQFQNEKSKNELGENS